MKTKILVIRFSSLGDVILTTPVFPNIKNANPNSHVAVLVREEFAAVFNRNPHIDEVIQFNPRKKPFSILLKELRQARYNVVIDLQQNMRSWVIRLLTGPSKVGIIKKLTWQRNLLVWFKYRSKRLKRSVRERMLDTLIPLEIPVTQKFTQLFPKNFEPTFKSFSLNPKMKYVGIAPGAKHNTKKWSPERFAEVANRLGAERNTMVLLLGSKEDQNVAKAVGQNVTVPFRDLTGWTSIDDLVALVSKLSMLITNDSALLHIGEALEIPLVALFGPTVRQFGFAPYRPTSRVVEVTSLSCRPCSFHGDEKCPLGHHKCMDDIDLNAVLFATSMSEEALESCCEGSKS